SPSRNRRDPYVPGFGGNWIRGPRGRGPVGTGYAGSVSLDEVGGWMKRDLSSAVARRQFAVSDELRLPAFELGIDGWSAQDLSVPHIAAAELEALNGCPLRQRRTRGDLRYCPGPRS